MAHPESPSLFARSADSASKRNHRNVCPRPYLRQTDEKSYVLWQNVTRKTSKLKTPPSRAGLLTNGPSALGDKHGRLLPPYPIRQRKYEPTNLACGENLS